MKAVIRRYRRNGDKVVATVILDNGYAVVSSEYGHLREKLVNGGIVGRGQKRFQVTDGQAFIEELPFAFSGGIMRAEITER